MAAEPVILSMREGIATLTLNKPEKHNAMDQGVIQACLAGLQRVAEDKTIRVVLLKANGENFCAGADIRWMQKMAERSLKENTEDALQLAALLQRIHDLPKPVIALIQGATIGGGLGLVAAADIAIASTQASFAFSEVKIGLVPSVVSPYIISAMGARAARYYFLTALRFTANEAKQLGLIHQTVEREALTEVGFTLARELLQYSPSALSEVKRLIERVDSQPISEALIHFTAEQLALMRCSSNGREGLQAFLEKREPKWS